MKPKRPDSAKSAATKKTLDSEGLQKDLNTSKFSQTFSTGVNPKVEDKDQFKQYIAEKEKDPKFKKYKEQSKLQQIPENNKPRDSSRLASKPFQKKVNSKIERASQKIKEPPKPQSQPSNEQQMTKSKGFAERNKQKMNTLKIQSQNKVAQEKPKPKINFNGFTVNVPGKSKQIKKEQPKEESPKKETSNGKVQIVSYGQNKKKPSKTKQQMEREEQMQQISAFIETVQARNISNYPARYDEFVQHSECSDLDKININDFLEEPTEQDYTKMKRRIQQFDQKLRDQDNQSAIEEEITQKTEEIDLDELIESQADQSQADQESQAFLSSISSEDLKRRNLFLTEILKGKITKEQISEMEEMDRSAMKLKKIEPEEDELELAEINMVKKKSNRLVERNKVEASGQVYRDCDYLSEEHQQRLEELLNGQLGPSPFEYNQIEQMRNRRIDEGIRMYRQLSNSIESSSQSQLIISQESLPKDPQLRKQAEQKILKEKAKNINERLLSLDKVIVNKQKVDNLLKDLQGTKLSSMAQSYLKEKNRQFEQTSKKLEEAQQIIAQSIKDKENLNRTLKEMDERFRELEEEVNNMLQMDEKEFRQAELNEMKLKMREVQRVESLTQQINTQIQQFELFNADMREKLRLLDEIESLNANHLQSYPLKENQTIDDLDKMITLRWEKDNECNEASESNETNEPASRDKSNSVDEPTFKQTNQ